MPKLLFLVNFLERGVYTCHARVGFASAHEFMQLYPNAKLLIAGKDDLARDRRKLLTAKIAITQGQMRDYEARLGAAFAHDGYLEELTGLRNQLETALSATPQAEGPSAEDLVARIKALQAAHTIEAVPRQSARAAATVAEPVTARIRRQMSELPCHASSSFPSLTVTVGHCQRSGQSKA